MKPSEIFSIVVRVIGLLLVLSALWQLFAGIVNLVAGGSGIVLSMFLYGIPALILGLWFLRGAEPIVSFAFPEKPEDKK